MDLSTSREKEGTCIAEAHPVKSFPNANTNGSKGGAATEENMQK